MEEKTRLNEEMLGKVNGGTDGNYDSTGRKCPECGRASVRLIAEVGDSGKFECDNCGCTFYSDI